MNEQLIGRLNTLIHSDRRITRREYQQLEMALFANGGLADKFECEIVAPLLQTHRFSSASDKQRLQSIVQRHAYTVEDYLAVNAIAGTRAQALREVADGVLHDERAVVQEMAVTPQGSLRLVVAKAGHLHTWDDRVSAPSWDALNASLAPLSVYEYYLAVEDYRKDNTRTPAELRRASAVQSRLTEHVRALRPLEKRGIRAYQSNGKYVVRMANQAHVDEPVAIGRYDFFRGAQPTRDVTQAMAQVLDELAPEWIDWLQARGLRVHLYHWGELMRASPPQEHPPRRNGGATPGGRAVIWVNIDASPQAVAQTLVHEIGHVVYNDMSNSPVRTAPLRDVVSHHFSSLKVASENGIRRHMSRDYVQTQSYEWFPDAFMIYQLGDSGLEFRGGLHGLSMNKTLSLAQMYEEFYTWDRVGFLMMAKLDQYVREGSPTAEEAFAWPLYAAAQDAATQPLDLSAWRDEHGEAYEGYAPIERIEQLYRDCRQGFNADVAQRWRDLVLQFPLDSKLRRATSHVVRKGLHKGDASAGRIMGETLARLQRYFPHERRWARIYEQWQQQQWYQ